MSTVTQEQAAPLATLTGMEKVKAALKGAKDFALGYIPNIPKALVVSGLILATSAGLGMALGDNFDLLRAKEAYDLGMIPARLAATLVLGMTLSAGMGAWTGVKDATEKREAQMAAQQPKQERMQTPLREKKMESPPVEVPRTPQMAAKPPVGRTTTNYVGP